MVDVPVPKARIGQLFASPSDDSRMFPIQYSEAKEANTLGLQFSGNNSAPPASIRFYNPGAVAARTSDDGHKLLGAIETSDLPGADGKPLPTAAFAKPEDGVAYYGYFIQARVGDQPTIDKIMKAYATGHPDAYKKFIKSETGIDTTQVLDDDQLASVAKAMFKWESGGTQAYSMNDQALTQMLDNVDIKAQIKRGRTAYKTRKSPNNNKSSNDSIGAALTALAQTTSQSLTQALDIDTSPATMAQRVAQQKESPAFSDAVLSHAMETGQLDKFGTVHYDPELKLVARY
jgi:hypothetical protein